MDILKISVVTFLSLCLDICLCQYFTSSFEIENLLETEKKLLDRFNDYLRRQQKNGMTFDSGVLSFIKTANQRNREVNRNHDYDNPITTYHILKRVVQDWSSLKQNLTCSEDHELSECPILTGTDVFNVVMKETEAKWPTELDLYLAVDAILNVQNVYGLTIDQLRKGKIGMAVVQPLDADDIFFIANAAKDSGKIYEAIKWLDYLVEHVEEFASREFSIGTLHRRLAASYAQHGMRSKAVKVLEIFSQKDSKDKGVSRDLEFLKSSQSKELSDEPSEVMRFVESSKKTEERLKYENICRHALKDPETLDSSLFCHIKPLYRTYGVSKIEVLARRPRVELVYEVMSSSDADMIQTYAEKSFYKKKELFPLKQTRKSSKQALESGPLCEGPRYKLLVNLTSRLEEITNFQMYYKDGIDSSECYKVFNEGLGSVQNFIINFWLSDVQFGGQIVFPKLNLAVPVVKLLSSISCIIAKCFEDLVKPRLDNEFHLLAFM